MDTQVEKWAQKVYKYYKEYLEEKCFIECELCFDEPNQVLIDVARKLMTEYESRLVNLYMTVNF